MRNFKLIRSLRLEKLIAGKFLFLVKINMESYGENKLPVHKLFIIKRNRYQKCLVFLLQTNEMWSNQNIYLVLTLGEL